MKIRSAGLVLLAGILWGCVGIFIRTLNSAGFSSMEIVFLRTSLGAIFLILYALVRDRSLLKIRLRDLWCFLGTGITGFAFFNWCYFTTMQVTSLCVAAVLLYTAPCIVMVLSAILFREKITAKKLVALVLALLGCMCAAGLFTGDITLTWTGLLIGLGSGLGYALVTIFTRYALNRGYHSTTIVIYTLLFAALTVFFMTDVRPILSWSFSTPSNAVYAVLFVLLTTVAPNELYTAGLSRLDNDTASIIVSVEPVAATVVGILAFSEALTFSAAAGVVLMAAALLVLNLNPHRHRPKSEPSGPPAGIDSEIS